MSGGISFALDLDYKTYLEMFRWERRFGVKSALKYGWVFIKLIFNKSLIG